MSNVLIVDASTKNLYVILLRNGLVFGGKHSDCLKRHSEFILPKIDEVLRNGGVQLKDVDVFACGVGCGSFTGIRVAISTVKGINAVLNKKLVSVNTLETFAYNSQEKDVIMDAGSGRFYYAAYCGGKCVTEPQVIDGETAEVLKRKGCLVFDEDVDLTERLAALTEKKIMCNDFVQDLIPLYLRKCQAEELKEVKK